MCKLSSIEMIKTSYFVDGYFPGVGLVQKVFAPSGFYGQSMEVWVLLKPFCDAFHLKTAQVLPKIGVLDKRKMAVSYKGKTRTMWVVNREGMLGLLPVFERTGVMACWAFLALKDRLMETFKEEPDFEGMALWGVWMPLFGNGLCFREKLSDREDALGQLARLYLAVDHEANRLKELLVNEGYGHQLPN